MLFIRDPVGKDGTLDMLATKTFARNGKTSRLFYIFIVIKGWLVHWFISGKIRLEVFSISLLA